MELSLEKVAQLAPEEAEVMASLEEAAQLALEEAQVEASLEEAALFALEMAQASLEDAALFAPQVEASLEEAALFDLEMAQASLEDAALFAPQVEVSLEEVSQEAQVEASAAQWVLGEEQMEGHEFSQGLAEMALEVEDQVELMVKFAHYQEVARVEQQLPLDTMEMVLEGA